MAQIVALNTVVPTVRARSRGGPMDLQLVRSFVEVARSGTFAAASERLFVTQSAVSLRIQRLEDALGRALFHRSPEGVRLNAAGEVFRGYAEEMLDLWEGARRAVSSPEALRLPLVRVGCEAAVWNWPVQPWLAEMGALLGASQISCEMRAQASEISAGVAAGETHLGFATSAAGARGLVCDRVSEEPIVLVACAANVSASAFPPILIHADWSEAFNAFHDLAFPNARARAAFSVPPEQVESLLLSLDDGAAWLPARRAAPWITRGRLHKVAQAPVFSQPIYALRRHDAEMSLVTVAQKALSAVQAFSLTAAERSNLERVSLDI